LLSPCFIESKLVWVNSMKMKIIFSGLTLTLVVVVLGLVPGLRADAALGAPASVVRHGPRDLPRVALTFDDNFRNERALPALQTLQDYSVPATMFVVGHYVEVFPEVTAKLAAGSFEIGDHTFGHLPLPPLSWGELRREIGGGTDAFRAATGLPTSPLFRPPYGHTTGRVLEAAGAEGFRYVVLWDVGASDWTGVSASTIRSRVLSNVQNGSIVLLHLSAPHTFEALPGIITGLRDRGFELVTVTDLLRGKGGFLDTLASGEVASAVERMAELRIMSGYSQDYFGPGDPITRAQFAKVSVLSAGLHTGDVGAISSPTFADVPLARDREGRPVPYPFDYVEEAVASGLIQGRKDEDGVRRFYPGETLTRLQLAQIVGRMVERVRGYPHSYGVGDDDGAVGSDGIVGSDGGGFTDVPSYAREDVNRVVALGLMKGYSDGRFAPWARAERGHVAVVTSRFLDLAPFGEE